MDFKAAFPHKASLANASQDQSNEANINSPRDNRSAQGHSNGSQERICDEHDRARVYESPCLAPDVKPWRSGDHYHHAIPKKEDPWEESFKLVLKFDEEMCRGWREEIDTLLVFAGLFSATVTAFTLVTYQQLQYDPDDIQIQLLAQIVTQLNNFQTGNASNTVPATQSPNISSFVPKASSVRVNIFWFTSLTLSLTAVLVGSLCKQWLREYQRYEGLSSKEAFSVRQLRYEGLLGWHVPKILYSLPLLLQAALVLFFGGLLELLWNINFHVASVVTAFVGIAMIFLIATTILPCVQNLTYFSKLLPSHNREPHPQCAFKSPQSWAFHLLITWIISLYFHVVQNFFYGTTVNYLQILSWHANDANWLKYDKRWQIHGKYIQRGFNWFDKTFIHGHGNIDAIYNIYCLESLDIDIAAGCVSQIIEENWNPLFPLVGLIQPTLTSLQNSQFTTDTSQDVTRDLIMSSYLVVHHKANPYISLCCIERCTRILNTSVMSNDLSTELTAVVFEMLNVIMPRAAVSEATIIQLATSLSVPFTSGSISSSDIPNFWLIFNHILQRAGDPSNNNNTPPKAIFRILLKAVEQWLLRTIESPTFPSRHKHSSVTSCAIGLSSMYWTSAKAPMPFIQSLQFEATNTDDHNLVSPTIDVQSVASLVRLLDRSLEVLGGSNSLLSPWAQDTWAMTKDRFMNQPDLEPMIELIRVEIRNEDLVYNTDHEKI